ncbi:hypothetical protein M2272_004925 [Mycobacterium frederiksbergense]|uniref:Uncharacterized protein n=1 Tax=Mycolicibacterium frederiksbergense TaxID=117567 RepID=A0ABT6L5P3_9MYCO|nr:hypothetical protein [Mycolicibacterium frederiksbergense]MDH6198266.1 hypothetical protein [Mycolicibacterium frederiksbergense]
MTMTAPAAGRAKPTVGLRPTITDAGEAHRLLAAGAVAGKVAQAIT